MRKLSTEEQTEPISFRPRKDVVADFRCEAENAGLSQYPAKFFEKMFKQWKEWRAFFADPVIAQYEPSEAAKEFRRLLEEARRQRGQQGQAGHRKAE
jgi:hypothetical protein